MPIGPNSVLSVDQKMITKVFDHVDFRLTDPSYMRDNRQGPEGKPYWVFVGGGSLSPREKSVIKEAYYKAGWKAVLIENSGDLDERPGLWSVTLTKDEE